MQVKKIASLCAIAFAAMSGQANAAMSTAEQAIVNDAVANGRVIFISGASATQKGFTGIIAKMFTGTPIRFANTTASSKNYEAVAGVLGADAGAWSGQNVIVIDRVLGGSVYGVDPVARATPIESLKVTSTTCGSSGSGTASLPYVCDVTPAGQFMAPDAGISDVAPALFVGPINTEGENAAPTLTEEELAELTATPIYSLAFGVPVTSNVGASVTFNKPLVSAIMAGNIGTWSQVDAAESGDMIVCRRVPGSGTQAVDNLYFGNFPCGEANTPANRDSSKAAVWNNAANTYTVNGGTGGLVVIENSTSGDVRNCLTKAVEAKTALPVGGYTTYGTKDRSGADVVVSFKNGVDHKAVGVLSMDSLSSSTTTSKWQFRSLDGAGKYTWDNTVSAPEPVATGTGRFPTLANLIDGTWDLQGWISFNIPNRTQGDKLDALTKFLVSAQDPAILASITDLKKVAAAIPGGDYSGDQVMRAQYLGNNQCAPLNRNY